MPSTGTVGKGERHEKEADDLDSHGSVLAPCRRICALCMRKYHPVPKCPSGKAAGADRLLLHKCVRTLWGVYGVRSEGALLQIHPDGGTAGGRRLCGRHVADGSCVQWASILPAAGKERGAEAGDFGGRWGV